MTKPISHEDILRVIAESGLAASSVAGNCFTFAVALRRILLPEGVLAVAVSRAILQSKDRYVGHAAVRFDGAFYHGEGWLDWESFKDWGKLDPHDQDFADLAGLPLKRWAQVAGKADIYETDEADLLTAYVKPDLLPIFEAALRAARERHRL